MNKLLKKFEEMLDGKSDYLSAERTSVEDLQIMLKSFKQTLFSVPLIDSLLSSISVATVILNKHRQIVYSNKSFEDCTTETVGNTIGLRIGEVLFCENSYTAPRGCGTNDNCKACKLTSYCVQVYESGRPEICDYEILNMQNELMSFRVFISRFENINEKYVICILLDTSDIQRRKMMEKVFIHDKKTMQEY